MKFLLTSGGLTNDLIIGALQDLVGKNFGDVSIAFIPTASNVESGDKWWVIKDLVKLQELKFKSVDIVDISALPKNVWLPRLNAVDILYFEGGDTFHLMRTINETGLVSHITESLKEKIWVGVSAGSMVVAPDLLLSLSQKIYEEDLNEKENLKGLGLINFYVLPHLDSQWFPKVKEEEIKQNIENIKTKIYVLDDNCAVKILDNKEEVVGDGKWFLIDGY
jgi:dipeptidase E